MLVEEVDENESTHKGQQRASDGADGAGHHSQMLGKAQHHNSGGKH